MTHGDQDRRLAPRLSLNAEAFIRLIFPTETASPNMYRGIASDISSTGLKVKSFQVDRALFHRLHRHTTLLCEIRLELPYLAKPVELRGTVAWSHFEEATKKEGEHAVFGVRFDLAETDCSRRLNYVLSRLGGDSYATPQPSSERIMKL